MKRLATAHETERNTLPLLDRGPGLDLKENEYRYWQLQQR